MRFVGFAVLALVGFVASAEAHPLAPSLLEVRQGEGTTYEVSWTTPSVRVRGTDLLPLLPPHCRRSGEPATAIESDRVVQSWTIDCGEKGVVGAKIGVDGLATAYTDVLLRVELADGLSHRTVLRADEPYAEIPASQSRWKVASGYFRLGVEHILAGWDHLAFVFGLLLLVGGIRQLLETVTAFTVGHSITLSAAVLGYVAPSSSWIEFAIAFSIFVLACELSRDRNVGPSARHELSYMRRFPWLMAGLFGLLHGAGFAGALAEVGLPQNEIPLALFSFNVGIEAGQIIFILGVMVLWRLARPLLDVAPTWVRWVPLYALGCMSVFWCLERLAGALI